VHNTFITGCDSQQEWMLPWFLSNFFKHNSSANLKVVDFGLSPKGIGYIKEHNVKITDKINTDIKSWFYKPKAILETEGYKKIWLDVDCEVRSSITEMFDLLVPNKLSMCQDRPWSSRRNELWYNSGVVGVVQNPPILKLWSERCIKRNKIGDQEVLQEMLSDPLQKLIYINEVSSKYNFLRLDYLDGRKDNNAKIVHWTGPKGKIKIREMMNG
jgi:hypothetical protein